MSVSCGVAGNNGVEKNKSKFGLCNLFGQAIRVRRGGYCGTMGFAASQDNYITFQSPSTNTSCFTSCSISSWCIRGAANDGWSVWAIATHTGLRWSLNQQVGS